ncbi:hypothetical protein Phi38:2_gp47 [Cellulophaga phage phi38:2]|uniref:hypothetical protein n=1 Tax=Cellulophaga phage phiSM TaxID=756280 RepID=UPI0002C0A421|nr:hypothetical protein CEPG_00048 [Cellulophaga phage phiSM]AGO47778.1 hypothetical protein Phi3ST:2_gp47 [Cellulophaga phage phi3ST:2]AGO49286.1 hypothetical protein Phi38:2_gp47 [Cellulophaga phage phi38:2]AGO49366.1 hypothetical protein Phi3:1_gp47 [Cellulophaga phage phi3:1]AGH07796.1 hypothetical protein CEPG_00048 [Cellulophaga phage phiSM]AGO48242.1 hypothetical protein PhiSM_gp47 [Cellulophaga phage phiSM]
MEHENQATRAMRNFSDQDSMNNSKAKTISGITAAKTASKWLRNHKQTNNGKNFAKNEN